MTVPELARELRTDPTRVRAWLRRHHPRGPLEHGQRWELDEELVAAVRRQFG